MDYAIVLFIKEQDAPGIVSTNWISFDRKSCMYPNVQTEVAKQKILLARELPGKNWVTCPIKILRTFATYHAARSHLSDAENTSNLVSEMETHISEEKRKRKRIPEIKEESLSSEVEYLPLHEPNDYPSPAVTHFADRNNIQSEEKEVTKDLEHEASPILQAVECIYVCSICEKSFDFNKTANSSVLQNTGVHNSTSTGMSQEIEQIKVNQRTILDVIHEMDKKIDKIDNKMDKLLMLLECQQSRKENSDENQDLEFMSSLPVIKMEDFTALNENLAKSSSFRQKLLKMLISTRAKDSKTLIVILLRKIMLDDVAEQFSLTGKPGKPGAIKESFEKTEIYKLISETCFRKHQDLTENVLRECMSDWLTQSKFRKSRREKRNMPKVAETEACL